jgi:hypothetical protein
MVYTKKKRLLLVVAIAIPTFAFISGMIFTVVSPFILTDAAIRCDNRTVDLLLRLGVNPDSTNELFLRNRRALQHAAARGRLDIMQMLIEHGADVNAHDSHNYTAFDWARNDEVRSFLSRANPQLSRSDSKKSRVPR